MAMSIATLPELVALDSASGGVRIPPGDTAPLTPRVRALLDTAAMRRLARVSQLGLVALVYPGATHSRLEHSLGVYRLALEFLRRLRGDERFCASVSESDAAAFVIAALVHDVGHWPFCHPIEDLGLAEIPRHEALVDEILGSGDLAEILTHDWGVAPSRVSSLIAGTARDPAGHILHSMLSGPIDVDKMDYLARDSLHAGVPYGRNFDQPRLLASLCLDERGDRLAIADKGRTAAELMVFARYVMFSEVYWHHTVRAATGMLQRAMWLVRQALEPQRLVRMDDYEFIAWLTTTAAGTAAAPLVDGLFGSHRRLHKRVASFDALHRPELHAACAGLPYDRVVAISERLAHSLAAVAGRSLGAGDVLIDAPPAEREVEFRIQVRERGEGPDRWRRLEEVSPVVRSLAHEQFDDLVKRVRIFVAPDVATAVASHRGLEELLLEAARHGG
jgi:HD superfamily phosphohydrolase